MYQWFEKSFFPLCYLSLTYCHHIIWIPASRNEAWMKRTNLFFIFMNCLVLSLWLVSSILLTWNASFISDCNTKDNCGLFQVTGCGSQHTCFLFDYFNNHAFKCVMCVVCRHLLHQKLADWSLFTRLVGLPTTCFYKYLLEAWKIHTALLRFVGLLRTCPQTRSTWALWRGRVSSPTWSWMRRSSRACWTCPPGWPSTVCFATRLPSGWGSL